MIFFEGITLDECVSIDIALQDHNQATKRKIIMAYDRALENL